MLPPAWRKNSMTSPAMRAYGRNVTTSRRSPACTSSSRSASEAVPEAISWTFGTSGLSRKNAYSARLADLRCPNTYVRPSPPSSSVATESISSSEIALRVASRSPRQAESQRSSRWPCGAARPAPPWRASRCDAAPAIASLSPA